MPRGIDPNPSGWKSLVFFGAAHEFLPQSYGRIDLRGVHWVTAAARCIKECPVIMEVDQAGLGMAPFQSSYEAIALEWVDRIYLTGLRRLGGGATLEQLHLSSVALRNLSGQDTSPPDPMFLSTIMNQIYLAGTAAAINRPFTAGNTAGANNPPQSSSAVFVPLQAEILERVRSRAHTLAPLGTPMDAIEEALQATARHPEGTTFRERFKTRVRMLGGNIRVGSVKEVSEDQYVVTSGKRSAKAWIGIALSFLRRCSITSGNARFLNPSSDATINLTLAIIQRNFTAKAYGLHLCVPRTPGCPTVAKLKEWFGEAAHGIVGTTLTTISVVDAERGAMWLWIRIAIQTFLVIDIPSFDFGLSVVLNWYISHLPTFQANAVPFNMVTREIAKLFSQVQLQRETQMSNLSILGDDDDTLSFIEPADLRESREKLFLWNREELAAQDAQFMRSFEQAVQSGAFKSMPGLSRMLTSAAPSSTSKQAKPQSALRNQVSVLDPFQMDKTKWSASYGQGNLCWWHSNSARGCSRKPCPMTHTYPSKYANKAFHSLSSTAQAAVMAACAK
jgi:hypothetical protein